MIILLTNPWLSRNIREDCWYLTSLFTFYISLYGCCRFLVFSLITNYLVSAHYGPGTGHPAKNIPKESHTRWVFLLLFPQNISWSPARFIRPCGTLYVFELSRKDSSHEWYVPTQTNPLTSFVQKLMPVPRRRSLCRLLSQMDSLLEDWSSTSASSLSGEKENKVWS